MPEQPPTTEAFFEKHQVLDIDPSNGVRRVADGSLVQELGGLAVDEVPKHNRNNLDNPFSQG